MASGQYGGIASLQTPPGNPQFVDLKPAYQCMICHLVLREALQTTCGHRLCEGCVAVMFDNKPEPVKCPSNEEDCEEQRKADLIPDPGARREVRKLKVYCGNHPVCSKILQWKDLEFHESECEHRLVPCRFYDAGCLDQVRYSQMESHQRECRYRPQPCQYCSMSVPAANMAQHHANDCEEIPFPCQWNCKSQPMNRRNLQEHYEICPRKQKECKFRQAGCDFVGNDEELQKHLVEDTSKHLEYAIVYMAKVEVNMLEIRRQLQEVSSERDRYQQHLQSAASEISNFKTLTEKLDKTNKELKMKMVTLTERIIHLERKVEDMAKKTDVDRHERDVRALQTSLTQVRTQIATIERNSGNTNRPGGQGQDNPELARRVDAHDAMFTQIDVQMAELDLRFQIVESTSFNGTLLWKLRDYSRRKQEAVAGKTLSLYSQPFYTHRFGYKMCARVYLNGDGVGKGSHMSLFFVIMKGEYDSLLPWPFQQKVTMILIDQTSGHNNLSDTFRPDPNSSSFKRPTAEMNIASGCPLFVAHTTLETPRYVKDDVLFLKFIVDLSSLNHP